MRLIPVEAATDDRYAGRVFCRADELLTGQRQWQGLWVSAPEVDLGYLLAKQALQGAIAVQQKPRLQALRQELGDKAEAITKRLFGSRLGAHVIQWITTENWTALECHLPRLRRALLWQALRHDPLNLLRYSIPEGARMWQQWRRYPQHDRTGHSVPPQQPGQGCCRLRRRGGLLLLVLLCMTTGCTGSRARETAAVTAPPAPEKVAINRVSSSRAKLSAPPRSKAKTPVTTVKPAAPPPPASPQQGEEQEGRVF